jgi:hypothetical protein
VDNHKEQRISAAFPSEFNEQVDVATQANLPIFDCRKFYIECSFLVGF